MTKNQYSVTQDSKQNCEWRRYYLLKDKVRLTLGASGSLTPTVKIGTLGPVVDPMVVVLGRFVNSGGLFCQTLILTLAGFSDTLPPPSTAVT